MNAALNAYLTAVTAALTAAGMSVDNSSAHTDTDDPTMLGIDLAPVSPVRQPTMVWTPRTGWRIAMVLRGEVRPGTIRYLHAGPAPSPAYVAESVARWLAEPGALTDVEPAYIVPTRDLAQLLTTAAAGNAPKGPQAYTIDAAAFRAALATGIKFAETSGFTPAIDGVNVRPANGGRLVEVAATNRYVLTVETVPVDDETRATFETLIPSHIAKRVLALIPAGTKKHPAEGAVTVSLDAEHRVAVAYTGNEDGFDATVTFSRPGYDKGDQFPGYRQILDRAAETPPDKRVNTVHLTPRLVAEVSKAVNARPDLGGVFTLDLFARNKPVTFTAGGGSLTVLLMTVRKEDDR